MVEKKSKETSALGLILVFVAGFAAFSLVGFVIVLILLYLGVLPTV